MRFRTEIELPRRAPIDYSEPILLLGSCFADEVGQRLEEDGFDVMRNPFGPLFNPLAIATPLRRAIENEAYSPDDFICGPRGYHCLDYASRFADTDPETLAAQINTLLSQLRDFISRKPTVILTLGTAWVFNHLATRHTVGNCHKFPAGDFERRRMSVDECAASLNDTVRLLHRAGIERVIITVSPIRHLADGLHGNNISKATLLLAANTLEDSGLIEYFPAYEILLDDLRDYRFFDADLKHPTPTAVDYIYECFGGCYFSSATKQKALDGRRRTKASKHRQIL